MPTINAGELRKGQKVLIDNDPCEILLCEFVKPGKGQALYKLKLKSLIKGSNIERTLRSGDSLESADVRKSPGQFMYSDQDNYYFLDSTNFEQYPLAVSVVGTRGLFLQENAPCDLLFFNDRLIDMDPPQQIISKVTYTEPAARGNTANGLTKEAQIETGATVKVPAFIEIGELIKVETSTGTYVERAGK